MRIGQVVHRRTLHQMTSSQARNYMAINYPTLVPISPKKHRANTKEPELIPGSGRRRHQHQHCNYSDRNKKKARIVCRDKFCIFRFVRLVLQPWLDMTEVSFCLYPFFIVSFVCMHSHKQKQWHAAGTNLFIPVY